MRNDKSRDDDRYGPEEAAWIEPVSRKPFRLKETTTDEEIEREMSERLSAVLEMRSLTASPEGWRELALYYLVQRGAPLEFVTDLDLIQGGHDGAAMETFILRSSAAKLKRSGRAKNNVDAAKLLAKKRAKRELREQLTSSSVHPNLPLLKQADPNGREPTAECLAKPVFYGFWT